jgi:hypothetical protein
MCSGLRLGTSSAERYPRTPRPHNNPRPPVVQRSLYVAPYPVTPASELQEWDSRTPRTRQGLGTPIPFAASGLQEGEGRMARTRTQLGTPYPYACTSGQPVTQATIFAPPPPHAVTCCYSSVSEGHSPRYKDLQYDGKSSWNS